MFWVALILLTIFLFIFFLTRHLRSSPLYVRPGLSIRKGESDKQLHLRIKGKSKTKDVPIDNIRIRLFSAFGKTKHLEMGSGFETKNGSFEIEVDLGPSFVKLKELQSEARKGVVTLELGSSSTGRTFIYNFPYPKFLKQIKKSNH